MKNIRYSLLAATLFLLATPLSVQAQNSTPPTLPGMEETAPSNVSVSQLPEVVDDAAMPNAQPLQTPTAQTQTAAGDDAAQKAIADLNKAYEDENLFYDADQLVPSGEFMKKGGTIKSNPITLPGLKLEIASQKHSATSSEAMLVSAERAVKLGRYESALEIYDNLYKYNKRDPRILMGRAIALQHLGRIDEAVLAYNSFLDRRPDDMNAQVNMLGLMGQKYPAVALQRLLDLYQNNERDVGVIAQIAVAYGNLQRYGDAMKFLGMAAAIEPNNPTHFMNMAIVADKANDKDGAISFYEKALEIDALQGSGLIPRQSIYERLSALR